MPAWITIYCRRSVAHVTGAFLKKATAPADWHTLAEGFDIEDDLVDAALEHLSFADDEVRYRPGANARPVQLHRWTTKARVEEEVAEVEERLSPPKATATRLAQSVEVIGIELGFPALEDMGVVLAYEVAEVLASEGDGLILDLDDRFSEARSR